MAHPDHLKKKQHFQNSINSLFRIRGGGGSENNRNLRLARNPRARKGTWSASEDRPPRCTSLPPAPARARTHARSHPPQWPAQESHGRLTFFSRLPSDHEHFSMTWFLCHRLAARRAGRGQARTMNARAACSSAARGPRRGGESAPGATPASSSPEPPLGRRASRCRALQFFKEVSEIQAFSHELSRRFHVPLLT